MGSLVYYNSIGGMPGQWGLTRAMMSYFHEEDDHENIPQLNLKAFSVGEIDRERARAGIPSVFGPWKTHMGLWIGA